MPRIEPVRREEVPAEYLALFDEMAAGRPTASISAPTTSVAVGSTLALSGSGTAQGTAGIASYLWEITSGTTLASFSGSTTSANATLQGVAAGTRAALGPLLMKAADEDRLSGSIWAGAWYNVGTPQQLQALGQPNTL